MFWRNQKKIVCLPNKLKVIHNKDYSVVKTFKAVG